MSTTYQDLTYTTFPDSIQSFVQMEDIASGDADVLAQYQSAMRSGDFAAAQAALANMTNADNKIINAVKLNTMFDTCIALERFYKTDIEPYVEQKQEEWQAIVDLFTNNFAYIGNWDNSTAYKRNNMVSRVEGPAEDVFMYIAIVDNTNVELEDTDTWRALTVKGDIGISGQGLTFMGIWQSTQNYIPGNVVSYGNHIYLAIQNSLDQTPTSNSEYWTDYGEFTTLSIFVEEEEPTNIVSGQMWFQIVSGSYWGGG